jgi:hypothetical protein
MNAWLPREVTRMASHEGLVSVHAAWNDWRAAEVRLAGLHDLHWFQPAGAPSSLLHAYIDCSDIVSGCIPHACDPASAPHRLRVCMLKRHAVARIYGQLAARAADGASGLASTPAP